MPGNIWARTQPTATRNEKRNEEESGPSCQTLPKRCLPKLFLSLLLQPARASANCLHSLTLRVSGLARKTVHQGPSANPFLNLACVSGQAPSSGTELELRPEARWDPACSGLSKPCLFLLQCGFGSSGFGEMSEMYWLVGEKSQNIA